MQTVLQPPDSTPINHIPDTDIAVHVEDDVMVTRIIDGKQVLVRWNDLPEDQRRAAYCNIFNIYGF